MKSKSDNKPTPSKRKTGKQLTSKYRQFKLNAARDSVRLALFKAGLTPLDERHLKVVSALIVKAAKEALKQCDDDLSKPTSEYLRSIR